MKPSKDLYVICNEDSGMNAQQFEEVFCNKCKNRECVRAGWAFSAWDRRILTQVDRLLTNPNIVLQGESTAWEGLSFEEFHEPQTIEVWGTKEVAKPEVAKPEVAEAKPEVVKPEASAPVVNIEPPREPTIITPVSSSSFNTSPQTVNLGMPSVKEVKVDPWSVTTEVAVGGKFKMGG